MAFGGFAPMPLRLGGIKEEGWAPEQHARLAADVAALYSSARFALLSYTKAGATVTVTAYNGRNGVGVSFAPVPTVNGTGNVTWTWPAAWTDDAGTVHTLAFVHADAVVPKVDAPHIANVYNVSGRTCSVITGAGTDLPVTLEVWSPEVRRPAHYGGALDKRPSNTEGTVPYAWGWYRHYKSSMGSAYRPTMDGLSHCEDLADARRQAAKMRAAEKLQKNSIPSTSDEKLAYWATVQRVPFSGRDVTEDIRVACSAKANVESVVNLQSLTATLQALLGAAFVDVFLIEGTDLDHPPDYTFWPVINPGEPTLDLGRGPWLSSRCRFHVDVTHPVGMTSQTFYNLMNAQLPALLDDALPSYATFSWSVTDTTNGFRCSATAGTFDPSASQLDLDGML